jgi:hypothetical protein
MAQYGHRQGVDDIDKVAGKYALSGLPDLRRARDNIVGQIQHKLNDEKCRQAQKVNDKKLINASMQH